MNGVCFGIIELLFKKEFTASVVGSLFGDSM
jgi:hypothetical protein